MHEVPAVTVLERDVIGERVKIIRRRRRWSQRKLGMLAGTSGSYISQLESGLTPRPGAVILQRIANALEVPITELTGEIEGPVELTQPDLMARVIREIAPDLPPDEVQRWLNLLNSMNAEDRDWLRDSAMRATGTRKRRLPDEAKKANE